MVFNAFEIFLICMAILLGCMAVFIFTVSTIAIVRKFVVAIREELRQKRRR